MPRICIVSGKSSGARILRNTLRSMGADVIRARENQPDCFNVGWGRPGADLNKTVPPNKLWELQKCQEAGVRTVPFQITEPEHATPWFGRLLKHSKGRDIVDLLQPHPHRDFWTQVIDKHREYRVHVFGGLAVRSGTKLKENGDFTDEQPIWNLDHGFQIRYEHVASKEAKQQAKLAVSALGLDFAAVDVLADADGRAYVLEVNTRPGLHGNTAVKYAEKILAAAG